MAEELNKKALLSIPLKYGVIATALNIVILLVLFYSGKHPLLVPPYMDSRIIIFLIMIYFAIREFKENIGGGYLHLWEGLIVGMFLYFVVALLGGTFVQFFTAVEPQFLTEYIQKSTVAMEAAREELVNGPQAVRMSPEEFQGHMDQLQLTTGGDLALDYFIKTLVIGFFIPLLYSVLFRRVRR